jgi:hypothetical protein
MIKRYTFLKHPFYFVLENSAQMVDGLEKCVGVFYNESVDNIEVLSFENKLSNIGFEDVQFVEDLRKSKNQANWIKKNQVSFEFNNIKMEQLSFADEEESSVLELRFLNSADKNYDVLYFYFKNNVGNFKLSKIDESMAITVKELIQNLLYRQIDLILQSNNHNAQIHQKIVNTFNDSHLQGRICQLEQERFSDAKSNYTYLLDKITEKEVVEFVLSNEAVKKMMGLSISLFELEELLLRSVEMLLNKYNPTNFYELTANDLIIGKVISKPMPSVRQSNLNKTRQFLDRYEAAAKILLSKNEKITGFNIGGNCYPKVSPAAISDVLKKHQKKIMLLFQQYPDRWSVIRSKFKPMVNIYERNNVHNQLRLGA